MAIRQPRLLTQYKSRYINTLVKIRGIPQKYENLSNSWEEALDQNDVYF